MDPSPSSPLRRLPKVDRLLEAPEVEALIAGHGRTQVVAALRESLSALREELRSNAADPRSAEELQTGLIRAVRERVLQGLRPGLRSAINATGVVLHTGLGRAVLAEEAAAAVAEVARNHSLLEVDPEAGERGSRLEHVVALLRELTGAEDALVVNNCAAAVFLTVSALAEGREVIISRGQLVEIGGSFRIPDVIRQAGAQLVEVGTTNKVRLSDYQDALFPGTALLLRVHPSNFRVVGFTEEPELAALVELGRGYGVPVMDDLGSGALVDLTRYGLTAEPTVQDSLRAGASVVTFSADKLLGGPQAGLILGNRELLSQMRKHPLMRVLRVDKLTLAALEATLRLYRDEARAMARIPTLSMLSATPEQVGARAEQLAERLRHLPVEMELASGISQVGGGSLPGEELRTTLLCLRSAQVSAAELSRRLRTGTPSVWGRIRSERVVLDLRTVREHELEPLAEALRRALLREANGDQGGTEWSD